jgi:hypothetical protein
MTVVFGSTSLRIYFSPGWTPKKVLAELGPFLRMKKERERWVEKPRPKEPLQVRLTSPIRADEFVRDLGIIILYNAGRPLDEILTGLRLLPEWQRPRKLLKARLKKRLKDLKKALGPDRVLRPISARSSRGLKKQGDK